MNLLARLRQDDLLNRVVGNSAYLFGSNSFSLVLSVLQGILASRLLGPFGWGLIAAVMAYSSTVNGLFSFRMSEVVVRYGGAYLDKGEKDQAAALIKAASLAETAVSVFAFLFVVLSAGFASRYIIKTPNTEGLFIAFSLGLLANFNAETSTGILQITEKIKQRGTITLIQNIISVLIVLIAFLLHGTAAVVLVAYLTGKVILGLGLFLAAQTQIKRALGAGWRHAPFSVLPPKSELFKFAFSSNLSATAILVFRESELLWVAFFLSPVAVGLYKNAYAIISLLAVPADPFILTVYPELNRLIVQKAWPRLRDFLRKVTTLAFSYNTLLAIALVVLGKWVLSIYGPAYSAAYPALIALLIGMAFNYTLFWNRPLLLSFGLPTFPLWATLFAGLLKVGLSFPLVPRYGILMEAALLSMYYILSVGLMVGRGAMELRRQESMA